VISTGKNVTHLHPGDIVGVPWLGYTCGTCKYCLQHHENLCENVLFTGYTMNGGYAEYTVAWEQYCFIMPAIYANASGAPLLCAGLIGYRSWQMIDPHAQNIGIYGFGAAAHILTQVARFQHKSIYAFTRPGDIPAQKFALIEGAVWTGNSLETPPVKLDAAIIFAPYGSLVPVALSHLDKGGTVICGGIHMSDIPGFTYNILWEERSIKSVANLTRADGEALLTIAQQVPVKTVINCFPLHQANEALEKLRKGNVQGAIALIIEQ
jgi:propanol-preferring alcohol dehydrogenase